MFIITQSFWKDIRIEGKNNRIEPQVGIWIYKDKNSMQEGLLELKNHLIRNGYLIKYEKNNEIYLEFDKMNCILKCCEISNEANDCYIEIL